uniref:Odorant receptor n=1 Tax=Ostrinia nubilalis TaxID=29057 RepID=A0A0C4UUE4_OSTNU|nr:putative pheromone receptor OR7a [Ostrinia nubilalis]
MMFITDGSDLIGVTRVLEIKYMVIIRSAFRVVGAWPSKFIGDVQTTSDVVVKYIQLVLNVVCQVAGILYLRENMDKLSFFELGHSYITVLMSLVSMSRIITHCTEAYQEIFSLYVRKIHLFNVRNDSEHAMEMHTKIHKLCYFLTFFIHAFMTLGILMFNLIPMYSNYINGKFNRETGAFSGVSNATMEHAVYYLWPFNDTTHPIGYAIIVAFNWYISLVCSINFCTFDLFLYHLVFHIWGHLKILIHNLETFPRPIGAIRNEKQNDYTEEESKQIYERLKKLVQHHNLIIDFIARISDTFGLSLFVYLCFHQVCGCILLLECSTLELSALIRYGPLTAIAFLLLIQVSLVFELLGSMTESLMNAVYDLPWEYMEVRHRRTVHIMLRQSQVSLNTRALNMVDIGSRTMIAIIKTSLSYFVMLRTFATDD